MNGRKSLEIQYYIFPKVQNKCYVPKGKNIQTRLLILTPTPHPLILIRYFRNCKFILYRYLLLLGTYLIIWDIERRASKQYLHLYGLLIDPTRTGRFYLFSQLNRIFLSKIFSEDFHSIFSKLSSPLCFFPTMSYNIPILILRN